MTEKEGDCFLISIETTWRLRAQAFLWRLSLFVTILSIHCIKTFPFHTMNFTRSVLLPLLLLGGITVAKAQISCPCDVNPADICTSDDSNDNDRRCASSLQYWDENGNMYSQYYVVDPISDAELAACQKAVRQSCLGLGLETYSPWSTHVLKE